MTGFFCKQVGKIFNYLRRKSNSNKELYHDLAPDDNLDNTTEYFSALEWALNNPKIKNIAISGPYGAGKSSLIKSFVKKTSKFKYICISLASFTGNDRENKTDLKEDELEKGILKQFFYKVKQNRIPQSRYRKVKVVKFWKVAFSTLISALLVAMGLTFLIPTLRDNVDTLLQNAVDNLEISESFTMLLGIGLIVAILLFISHIVWLVISNFRIKEINFSEKAGANATTIFSDNDAIFNRELDEIVYFFEVTGFNVVFIEDLDRFDNIEIFVKLRELNTILNSYEAIKNKIVFVYAVRDDMFKSMERTKFFEYILPVIPIINSTNSGEKLLERVKNDKEFGFDIALSDEYITMISSYISDMRLLINIYNEFITFKKVLKTDQKLRLSDEIMFSIMVFKNVYPKEFAELQNESGIVKDVFKWKRTLVSELKSQFEEQRASLITTLQNCDEEIFDEQREVKAAMLAFMTEYKGSFTKFISGSNSINFEQIMDQDFELEKLRIKGTVHYYGGVVQNFDGKTSFVGSKDYIRRYNDILSKAPEKCAEYRQKIAELDTKISSLSSASMKELLSTLENNDIFPDNIRENKLLIFLLRQGYINEEYQTYINYFHGNSITKDDMNFILSVRDREALDFSYLLTMVNRVIQRLLPHEFEQKEIYNFNLVDYLISDDDYEEKRDVLFHQLSNGDEVSTRFINEYFDKAQNQQKFIILLCKTWASFWDYIEENAVLTAERKDQYLSVIIENYPSVDIECLNEKGNIKKYFEENSDILHRLNSVSLEKMKSAIDLCSIKFVNLEIDGINSKLLDWIFDSGYYKITFEMLQSIFAYKSPSNISKLSIQNFTTIRELSYSPLIKYIDEDFQNYITSIVLGTESNTEETLDTVLYIIKDLRIGLSVAIELVIKENVLLDSLSRCCFEKFTDNEQQDLWNAWISVKKLNPSWENVKLYWEQYGVTNELLELIIVVSDKCPQEMDVDFIKDVINSELEAPYFEKLIDKMPIVDLAFDYSNINSEHMKTLIQHRYFDFTVEVASAIKRDHPELYVMAISIYKENVKADISAYNFDLENIERIIDSILFTETEKVLFIEESFLTSFSDNIAQFLSKTPIILKKDTFHKA